MHLLLVSDPPNEKQPCDKLRAVCFVRMWTLFLRPNDEGEDFFFAGGFAYEERGFAIAAGADGLAPGTLIIVIYFGSAAYHALPYGRAPIEMGINICQHSIIVLIRMLVRGWIIRIIHTGAEIGIVEVFILMIQPEGVPDFLTHHEIAPRWCIVCRRIEVRVVELGHSFGNVTAADPYLSEAEPAVVAVFVAAHFYSSGDGFAVLGIGTAGDDGRVQD